MTNSVRLSARHARISRKMAYEHRERDKEFAKQWDEAIETAVDLLHAKVFQRCLEGDLEPVYHMGVVVDYVRKFDSKLQIEMLRAYRPDRFKTPGTQVNIGARGDIFVLTEEQRHELQRINREYLLRVPLPSAAGEGARVTRALPAGGGSGAQATPAQRSASRSTGEWHGVAWRSRMVRVTPWPEGTPHLSALAEWSPARRQR